MSKADLSERDICTRYITPAIQQAGWDLHAQVREEVTFTQGRIIVRGKLVSRGQTRRADYILSHKPNLPLAVVEAKDNTHSVGAGMQQALAYAEALDIPFVYSSNGDAFLEHDRTVTSGTVERELPLAAFPSPDELWARYCVWKGLSSPAQQQVVTQDYYSDGSGRGPRYYQQAAINRVIEAIANGQRRLLLVMATGTGKTYTAFQIIWRLWKSGARKRILFLADRNILVDQTRNNDFKPFGSAMTKIQHRQADKSYEIYLALYQAVTGTEEAQNIYRQFSRDFFDLIVVDECHRGSAAADSAWREILEYFTTATQIGLTATPKETKDVSNIDYFGEPVYTYSLRQGIEDGFLAPYKVIRIDLDKDLLGWRPEHGKRDKNGVAIEDRVYNQQDFDRTLVLDQRTQLVARKVAELLRATDPYAKTIIFCEDIDHAERMRQALVNAVPELAGANRRYVVRITGDNDEGKAELDHFIDPESRYPVIATTSKLLTTGVDAQTCKLIVLDQRIQSMTEFKQIIGRGTRINEDYGKYYFTIVDFKKATELFADPAFDGDPVQIYVPGEDDPPVPPDEELADPPPPDAPGDDTLSGGDDGSGLTGDEAGGRRRVKYMVNTPRAVTQFMVDMVNPRLGERLLDPASGTGGFLVCAVRHLREQVRLPEDEARLQEAIYAIEKKPLPYLLCVTNLTLHDVAVDLGRVRHDNTLARPLISYTPKERVDVILTNPPFGGMEEDGIEQYFPQSFRTRETADLFLVLIIHLLKDGGRGAIVLPDGTLFGEGIKTRVKEKLLTECNLHTIVRLPNGVFAPYTGIKTNLLFFTKGEPTREVWYYEHPYPPGAKSYSKTKPIRIEEFGPEKAWWDSRVENEYAWRVPVETIRANGYNLDLKNPHQVDAEQIDPEHLLARYQTLRADVAEAREALRRELAASLER